MQNDNSFTISSSVLWTHLRPETCVATSRVLGRKETKCLDGCLEKQNINYVAGQGQPKHLTAWPAPFFKTQRIGSDPYASKHVIWRRVFQGAGEFKVRSLIWWTSHFAIYVRWLLDWLHIFATRCWWVSRRTKQLSSVAILLYRSLAVTCSFWFHNCFVLWATKYISSAKLKRIKF